MRPHTSHKQNKVCEELVWRADCAKSPGIMMGLRRLSENTNISFKSSLAVLLEGKKVGTLKTSFFSFFFSNPDQALRRREELDQQRIWQRQAIHPPQQTKAPHGPSGGRQCQSQRRVAGWARWMAWSQLCTSRGEPHNAAALAANSSPPCWPSSFPVCTAMARVWFPVNSGSLGRDANDAKWATHWIFSHFLTVYFGYASQGIFVGGRTIIFVLLSQRHICSRFVAIIPPKLWLSAPPFQAILKHWLSVLSSIQHFQWGIICVKRQGQYAKYLCWKVPHCCFFHTATGLSPQI